MSTPAPPPTPATNLTYARTRDDFEHLMDLAEASGRTDPIILLSPFWRGDYPLRPERIADTYPDLMVCALNVETATLSKTEHGGAYSTWGGATRIIGATETTSRLLMCRPHDDRKVAYRNVAQAVERVRATMNGRLAAGSQLAYSTSTGDTTRAPEPAPAPERPTPPSTTQASTAQVSTVPSHEYARERAEWADRFKALTDENMRLREQISALTATITRLNTPPPQPEPEPERVYADDEQQLRYDIEQAWLRHLPEPDRDAWPLRAYTIGPDLLATVHDHKFALASYPEIVAACVDVLTRRAYQLPARSAHPHRNDADRNSAATQLVRSTDQACAYRCTIASRTGGPRLLWWELTDGSAELARVAHHDDYRIR